MRASVTKCRASWLVACLHMVISVSLALCGGMRACMAEPADHISEMIRTLVEELNGESLAAIYREIRQVPDEAVRDDLTATLHGKLDEIFELRVVPDSVQKIAANTAREHDVSSKMFSSAEEMLLTVEIEHLQFGDGVSANHSRNELVEKINQVQDPGVRDRLLQYLDDREKISAQQAQ